MRNHRPALPECRPPLPTLCDDIVALVSRQAHLVDVGARTRACVVQLEGCEDEVVVGMVLRHLSRHMIRTQKERHLSVAELATLLAVLIKSTNAIILANAIVPWPNDDSSTQQQPDAWPYEATVGALPADLAAPIDPIGPFGLAARGAVVRACVGQPAKGDGVFATRWLRKGELVGLYTGEHLTYREFWSRHGGGFDGDDDCDKGAAEGSSANGAVVTPFGKYTFRLPPYAMGRTAHGERVFCVDAQDPSLSSWTRYLNHAPGDSHACNVAPRVDVRGAIWFVVQAERIEPGSELCFDYGGPTASFAPDAAGAGGTLR